MTCLHCHTYCFLLNMMVIFFTLHSSAQLKTMEFCSSGVTGFHSSVQKLLILISNKESTQFHWHICPKERQHCAYKHPRLNEPEAWIFTPFNCKAKCKVMISQQNYSIITLMQQRISKDRNSNFFPVKGSVLIPNCLTLLREIQIYSLSVGGGT